MKILIAGLGSIGFRHANNFKQLGVDKLVGFDPVTKPRDKFEKNFNFPVVDSLEKGLAYRPDLTVISSPNCHHIEQAIMAAKQGSHLFIEKPLSHSHVGLDILDGLIKEKNLFAHVGSNWKFHPAFITMKKMINDRVLGKVTGVQIIAGQWLPDWHPDEDYRKMYSSSKTLSGGVVLDSHEFDSVTWLLGPVEYTYGFTAQSGVLDIETEDVAVSCLKFINGILGTVHIDYIQRSYRRRYHISGNKGTLEWDYLDGKIKHYDADKKKTNTIDVQMKDLNEMYLLQTKHIIKGVQGIEKPVTSIEDAVRVMDILLQIKG